MKLEIEGTPTISTGVEDAWDCAIAQNDVAFDVWSNTLYTRKERAIVRELSCNALDAHVAAGKAKVPFEIHLPTHHEPYFSITDFGTGLSHQEMKTLFTLYFGSNKRDSNKFIGALGLGSKSPYCYKGNGGVYTVISTKDGVTRSYVASKKDKKPHMEQSGPTLETPNAPNGVKIQFAVDTKDIYTWENEAKVALEFITPTPKVNVAGFEPSRFEYTLKTDKWAVRKEARTAFGYQVRCIMGNVQYQLGDLDKSLIKSEHQRKILEMPIDMFFPLGALEFAPSREALQITDKTVNAVLAMCDLIFEEFIETVKAKIDACQTLWDAQVMLFDLINVNSKAIAGGATMGGLITQALNKGRLYGNYKNFTFDERFGKLDVTQYDHVGVTMFEHNQKATVRAKKALVFQYEPGVAQQARQRAKSDPNFVKPTLAKLTVEPKTHFVINDTNQPGDKFVHFLIQQSGEANGKKVVYVIHRNHKSADLNQVVKEAKELLDEVGNPKFELMSELMAKFPQLVTMRGSGGPRVGGLGRGREIVVFKDEVGSKIRYSQTGWTKAWRNIRENEVTEYAGKKKYYVVIDKLVATDAGFENAWDMEEFVKFVRTSGKFAIDSETLIFGVKRNSKLLQNNNGEFVELMNYVFNRVNSYMTPTKTLSLSLYFKPFDDACAELLEHIALNQPLSSSPVQQFALALEEAKGVKEYNWHIFRKVLNYCEARGKYKPGLTVSFPEKWETIKKQYPMLQFLNGYEMKRERETVLDYIRLVDETNQREALVKAAAASSDQAVSIN